MEAIETFENAGFTVSIYQEEDPGSPREWDNLGKMVCWHRRANLGDETIKTSNYQNMDELVASFNALVCIPLYLYEHSGMTMTASYETYLRYPDRQWDAGQVGFIYVTEETLRKEYSIQPGQDIPPETLALAKQVLVGEVEEYDQYLTGDVYGYVVKDTAGEHVDSCWGFFGLEYAREEAQAALASASDTKEVKP